MSFHRSLNLYLKFLHIFIEKTGLVRCCLYTLSLSLSLSLSLLVSLSWSLFRPPLDKPRNRGRSCDTNEEEEATRQELYTPHCGPSQRLLGTHEKKGFIGSLCEIGFCRGPELVCQFCSSALRARSL